jgi:hypothetical protein
VVRLQNTVDAGNVSFAEFLGLTPEVFDKAHKKAGSIALNDWCQRSVSRLAGESVDHRRCLSA